MTCIVGMVDSKLKQIWMGGDSAGMRSGNFSLRVRADKKIFSVGDFLFGFCGSYREAQLLQYSFDPPEQSSKLNDEAYMSTIFINAVHQCLKRGGALEKEDEVLKARSEFLVGYKGHIYQVYTDFQVAQMPSNFAAAGCAEDIAMGALYSLSQIKNLKLKPERRILLALQAAEEYNAGVRGPFHLIKMQYE